jgi:predicted RNase H-like HicB family nuclease
VLSSGVPMTTYKIEIERENDGRWIAEIPDLPGAMAYGETRDQAIARVEVLALRVVADRIEAGEMPSERLSLAFDEP